MGQNHLEQIKKHIKTAKENIKQAGDIAKDRGDKDGADRIGRTAVEVEKLDKHFEGVGGDIHPKK